MPQLAIPFEDQGVGRSARADFRIEMHDRTRWDTDYVYRIACLIMDDPDIQMRTESLFHDMLPFVERMAERGDFMYVRSIYNDWGPSTWFTERVSRLIRYARRSYDAGHVQHWTDRELRILEDTSYDQLTELLVRLFEFYRHDRHRQGL